MNGGTLANDLDPRKRALTVEHLLTQTSGLDCDDSDPNSPGNEDAVAEQTAEPDWWKLTLALKMIRDPGTRPVYCSVQPNLVGGVLRTAAGRPLVELFHDLIAEPLEIRRYWMNLTPTGEAYMGGGVRFRTRRLLHHHQALLAAPVGARVLRLGPGNLAGLGRLLLCLMDRCVLLGSGMVLSGRGERRAADGEGAECGDRRRDPCNALSHLSLLRFLTNLQSQARSHR